MNTILKFCIENWYIVVMAILALIFVAVKILYFYKLPTEEQMKILKKFILSLVVEAREKFTSNMGELKFAAVIEWFYERCPEELRILVSQEQLERLIQEAYEYMVSYLTERVESPSRATQATQNGLLIDIDMIKIYK